MRVFLLSVIMATLLAAGTAYILAGLQEDATMAYTSPTGARVSAQE